MTIGKKAISGILRIFDPAGGFSPAERAIAVALCLVFIFPFDFFTPHAQAEIVKPAEIPSDLIALQLPSEQTLSDTEALPQDSTVNLDAEMLVKVGEINDSIPPTEVTADDYPYGLDGKRIFNPSPTRAVWLSALCPGLGQIYNRRYWKLPIVVGGFMGLGYAMNWNNNQYQDYVQGYRDLVDSDPNTKSYLDFFPPTVNEADLDIDWLTRTFKSRRDYFRRNRDLCIICFVGMYLICMIDAYIDASMAHFDISPDLSLDLSPTLMRQPNTPKPAIGLNWAFTF